MGSVMRIFIVLALALTTPILACAGPPPDEGVGSAEALTSSDGCDRYDALERVTGDRRLVLDRAFGWLDARVPYNQSKMQDGYRTDCSGFVSMCWQLSTSFTTAGFSAPSKEFTSLASYADLQPGDALVRRVDGSGHIVIFVRWRDLARSSACVIHEAGVAEGMRFHSWTASNLQASGYRAIRPSRLGYDTGNGGADPGSNGGEPGSNGGDTGSIPLPPPPPPGAPGGPWGGDPPEKGGEKGGGGYCAGSNEMCGYDADCCSGFCDWGRCSLGI